MKLNQKMEVLLINGAKSCGLNPEDIMSYIEESLTFDEYDACQKFLAWLVAKKKTYGYNIQTVWATWQKSLQ